MTVLLKDGKRYDGVVVAGGTTSIPFSEADIEAVQVKHDRPASRRQIGTAPLEVSTWQQQN